MVDINHQSMVTVAGGANVNLDSIDTNNEHIPQKNANVFLQAEVAAATIVVAILAMLVQLHVKSFINVNAGNSWSETNARLSRCKAFSFLS